VQLFVYDATPRKDSKSAYLRADAAAAGCTWRSVATMGERASAELIRRDRIDILIELTGHTAHNRLGVMRYRPAPVQMTWIGYPNSTGLKAVDYRCSSCMTVSFREQSLSTSSGAEMDTHVLLSNMLNAAANSYSCAMSGSGTYIKDIKIEDSF
jgi:predicted O-linked N-acetylglucosamine transferase (SPINDLY family)